MNHWQLFSLRSLISEISLNKWVKSGRRINFKKYQWFLLAATSKVIPTRLVSTVDLVSGEPQGFGRTTAGLNNMVPLAGMRNELGKLVNPYLKEINGDIFSQVRSRNQVSEHLTTQQLPIKYDMLTGKPIGEWDFPTRMLNMINPFFIEFGDVTW